MRKIAIITTQSSSIDNWIKPFLPAYHEAGVDVSVISSMTDAYKEELLTAYPYVHAFAVNMPRGADFLGSLRSIPALTRLFRREKFDLIQYSTPNASFYSAIAGTLARVPVRLYCQWGMVFVSLSGVKRKIFETIERITCRLSTVVQPDSEGNLNFCRENGFYSAEKSGIIWNGSAKGVDLQKFDIAKKDEYRAAIRRQYGIGERDRVLGFVGRLGRDKGCNELFAAFQTLAERYDDLKLLFVGPIEKEDTIEQIDYFHNEERIVKTGRVPDVWRYYAAMDLFILPSYREGFGMSVVEAEAMGVPVLVTDIPGPTNGMQSGVTGETIPVRDADAIVRRVCALFDSPDTLARYAAAGPAFARERFDANTFCKKLIEDRLRRLP